MSSPCIRQYTYFSGTINNPEENDFILVRNPNEKYIRQLIWTNEVGAEGTPHIQMYVRFFRNQTLNFLHKLYPRGHFKPIDKDDYNENAQRYVQKDDETTRGKHVITTNEAIPEMERIMMDMFVAIRSTNIHGNSKPRSPNLRQCLRLEEDKAVMNKLYLSKMFVSPMWERLFDRFQDVYWNIACNTVLYPGRMEVGNIDSEDEDEFNDED